MSKLELKDLQGGSGLAAIPGVADVWNHALDEIDRVHRGQDMGKLLPDGKVELTMRFTFSRASLGSTKMDISHVCGLKIPGYVRTGTTAHKDGVSWVILDEEATQPDLFTGATEIKPRGGV